MCAEPVVADNPYRTMVAEICNCVDWHNYRVRQVVIYVYVKGENMARFEVMFVAEVMKRYNQPWVKTLNDVERYLANNQQITVQVIQQRIPDQSRGYYHTRTDNLRPNITFTDHYVSE